MVVCLRQLGTPAGCVCLRGVRTHLWRIYLNDTATSVQTSLFPVAAVSAEEFTAAIYLTTTLEQHHFSSLCPNMSSCMITLLSHEYFDQLNIFCFTFVSLCSTEIQACYCVMDVSS